MIILLFLSTVFSSPTSQSIVVCYISCPEDTPGHIITVSSSDTDLSSKVDQYLGGTITQIYFYNLNKFVFQLKLDIFEGHTVEFLRLDDSLPADVEFDCTEKQGKSTGMFTFKKVDIDFSSLNSLPCVELGSLTIEDSSIDFFKVEKSLIVGSLTADKSILVFADVTIKTSYTSPGIALNIDSGSSLKLYTTDFGAQVTFNMKTITFSFDQAISPKRFDIVNKDLSACTCEVEYQCTDVSKLVQFSFTDMATLYYLNTWPDTAITNVIIDDGLALSIYANSTVLPISFKSRFPAKIFVTQESTIITGDILGPVIFQNPTDKFLIRKSISLKGSFSGSLLDCGSSYFDVTISNLASDITSYGNFPFAIRVGTGGASTLNVLKSISETTKMTGIAVYPDFIKYLPDDNLQKLLSTNWTILNLAGVSFSISTVNVIMQSNPFIHGFIDRDSCISVRIESSTMILSASPPSLLPLNICYDGDKEGGECSPEDGIEIDSIELITNYFEDGMKYLNLSIKAFHVSSLDLTSLDYGYDGVRIIIKGGSNTVLDKIDNKEGLGIDYLEIDNIILGSTTFYIKEIAFNEVKTDGHPTFTFKNCQLVAGDDSFIQNISPGISTVSKIPKISYKMDKYDAMTVTNDKFIFYDIAMNDLSDPAELIFDVVDFLDIIYDVGITETAEDNDLNITMATKNPPSFNITFRPLYSTGVWDEPELILYSWDQTKDANFKTYFIHDKFNVKVVLTQPYKPEQLIPVGTGIVTYVNDYNNSIVYCSTPESDKGMCPPDSEYVSFNELDSKLSGCLADNITVYIKSGSGDHPTIDLYSVNKKTTYFTGLTDETATQVADYIEIKSSNTVDEVLTKDIFTNINIKTTQETTKLVFGEVSFDNVVLDSAFKNVEVSIDDFFCEYKYLSKFKKITITDNLVVKGELATEESVVDFTPDDNANDLKATITSDVTLLLGEKYIKIGKTKMQFGDKTSICDIVLSFESSAKNIQINKDDAASDNLIPIVQIQKSSGASFTFSNNWKLSTDLSHTFLFYDIDKTKIYLTGANTPVSFSADGEISIIAKAENVGITGFFDFHDMSKSSSINVLYEGVSKSVISVAQYINIINNVVIRFTQPNIEFNVDAFSGSNPRADSIIEPELFTNLEGDSLLVIHEIMNNVKIENDFKVQVPITEDISNQKVIDYYSKNHTLIKINKGDTGKIEIRSFTLIGTQPTTHGFTETNMYMTVDELTGDISLFFRKNPLLIPYNLCYKFDEGTSSCEITLTEDNIDNFADLLPSGVLTIQARFGEENTKNFNLNIPKIKGSNVIISQQIQAQLAIRMLLGNDIISLLSLNQVSGRVMDSTTFKVSRIEISNGAEVDQTSGFGIINIDFDTVWKVQVFPSCTNEIILNLTASSLTFTDKGWKVNEDNEIDQSAYPNLKFYLDSYITTKLDVAKGLTEIKSTTFYTNSRKFVLGSNWPSVVSTANKVNIVFEHDDTDNLVVTTSSYPFLAIPQLMSASTVQIDSSVLPYEVPQNITLVNVNSEIDFSNVKDEPEKAHIYFEGISFQGLSTLSAKGFSTNDDIFANPIIIKHLEVIDDSTVSLNNALINKSLDVYGASTLTGDFDVSVDLDILLKWKLNKMPKILITTIPDKVPQLITFSFDDVSINGKEKDYENYLYHHSFELIRINKLTRCETWKSIFVFNSPDVSLFGTETIFDIKCDSTNLVLYGARHVSDSQGGKKLSPGAIIGIVFIILVIIGAVCFGVYIYLKKRKSNYQQLDTDVLKSSELNQAQYTK